MGGLDRKNVCLVLLSRDVFIGVDDEPLEDNGGTFMDGPFNVMIR